jgi:hypothetical protein
MQRRRSVPHTFEERLAAEKAKLEAQVTDFKPGPQRDALFIKIRARNCVSHERVAFIARLAAPDLAAPHRAQRRPLAGSCAPVGIESCTACGKRTCGGLGRIAAGWLGHSLGEHCLLNLM